MSGSDDIVHSAALMLLSQVMNLLLGLATTVFIARALGAENFGVLTSLIATIALLAIVPDFGFSPIIVRELVQTPERTNQIVGTSFVLRLILFAATTIAVNVLMFVLRSDMQKTILINVMLLNVVFSSKLPVVRNVFESVFRAQLKLAIPLGLAIIDSVLLFTLVLTGLRPDTPLVVFVMIYTFSNVPGFVLMALAIIRGKNISLDFDWVLARNLMKYSFPIFLYVVFITIYSNIDILLLQHMWGDYQTGIYGAAMRLSGPLSFIPNAITVALYPSLSLYARESAERIDRVFRLGFKVLMVSGIGIAVIGFFVAKWIVLLLYGDKFLESGGLLTILLFSQTFAFLSFFFTNVNTAINKQSHNTVFAVVVCGVNVGLNLLLIPLWSTSGAAIARLTTETIGCILLWSVLWKSLHVDIVPVVNRILAFGIGFSALLFLVHSLNMIVFTIVGAAGFVVLLFISGVFTESEVSKLRAALRLRST